MKFLQNAIVPHPPLYELGKGKEYAKVLAEKTQGLSLLLTLIGWLLVVAGALLAIAGSILGSHGLESGGLLATLGAHKGLLCSTFAIVFAGAGWQLLDRASAATRTASVATKAIMTATLPAPGNEEAFDRSAYEACVQAKSSWLEGRMSNDRLETILTGLSQPSPSTRNNDQTKDEQEERKATKPKNRAAE